MNECNKRTAEEIKEILENHTKWLNNDNGERAVLMKADLSGADLMGANLSIANLMGANLMGANLRGANLREADLFRADLRGADLMGANLFRADLIYADLFRANLMGANLRGANLREADLNRANLRGADLRGANLFRADLIYADLFRANLMGANLMYADLGGANLINTHIDFPLACPDKGAFIGWKKCLTISRTPVIVKLRILSDAKRSSATGRKCRCDRAKVLDIQDMYGNRLVDVIAHSDHDHGFTYEVGKVVSVDSFDDCRWHECAPGIHFFITRQEAVAFQ